MKHDTQSWFGHIMSHAKGGSKGPELSYLILETLPFLLAFLGLLIKSTRDIEASLGHFADMHECTHKLRAPNLSLPGQVVCSDFY